MTSDNIGQLVYLLLLGTAVVGWFFTQNREAIGKVTQQALAWGLIFLGVIAGVGLWPDVRDKIMPQQSFHIGGTVEVPRSPDGHYYLTLQINGADTRFVVDTGATDVVLTQEDARSAGIDPSSLVYSGRATTANGVVETAPVRLQKVELGEMVDLGVRASVNGAPMAQSLLGMSYLQRFERIEITGGKLLLHR